MAKASPAEIKELMKATGVGMMECKKAIEEADGDKEKAITLLREKGLATQAKKSGRIAAEGIVTAIVDGNVGVLLEVNTETDFAANTDDIKNFVAAVAKTIIETNPADVEDLKTKTISGGTSTVGEVLTELAGMKIRVMGSDTCIAMMNAMGGVGVAMAQGDVYSAIQTGTLDGAENNIITYVDLVQYEVAPYYNRTGHLMIPDELCINAKVFDSMSAEDQEALKKCASESIDYMFNLCAELRSDYEAKAAEKGVIFSDADVPAFQALCQDLINDVANRTDMTKAVYEAIVSER